MLQDRNMMFHPALAYEVRREWRLWAMRQPELRSLFDLELEAPPSSPAQLEPEEL